MARRLPLPVLLLAEGLRVLACLVVSPVVAVYGAVVLSFLLVVGSVAFGAAGDALPDPERLFRLLDRGTGGAAGWIRGDGNLLTAAPRLLSVVSLGTYLVGWIRERNTPPPPPGPLLATVKTQLTRYAVVSGIVVAAWAGLLIVIPYAETASTEAIVHNTLGMTAGFIVLVVVSLVPVTGFLLLEGARAHLLARARTADAEDPEAE